MSESIVLTLDEAIRINDALQKKIAGSFTGEVVDILQQLKASDVTGKLKVRTRRCNIRLLF